MSDNPTPSLAATVAGDRRQHVDIGLLLDDRGQARGLRRSLVAVVAITAALLGWATFAQVDELARAKGEIQPSARVQAIQSEEGGTIVRLHVKEGDAVTAGQAIAEFIATDMEKLRRQTETKLASLQIQQERMLAILENRQPDFSPYERGYPMLVREARITYREELASREAAIAARGAEGQQQRALIGGAERERALVERQIAEARGRLARLEDGERRGVVSVAQVSDARQQVTGLEVRLSDAIARAAGMRSTAAGVDSEVAKTLADFNLQLSVDLTNATEEFRVLQDEHRALEERQGRIEIKSPVAGVVTGLPTTTEGAVVPPGGTVAEIVPVASESVMEVMIAPRDIGFVKEGQRARVRFDSFDSARFGYVEGKVKRIAPTSTKPREGGAPFYKAELVLATPYVGEASRRLIPGMTGEADIATGRKSVMQFLLKPVFLAADTAFHER